MCGPGGNDETLSDSGCDLISRTGPEKLCRVSFTVSVSVRVPVDVRCIEPEPQADGLSVSPEPGGGFKENVRFAQGTSPTPGMVADPLSGYWILVLSIEFAWGVS